MTMTPGLRKLALTAHVASSVGWLGAIVAFLALALAGLTTDDPALARGSLLVAEPVTRFAIIPLAVASLLTGLVQGLGTQWGLFRHYWVIFKLAITVIATVVLLMYTETVGFFADVAAEPRSSLEDMRAPTFVLHSAAALLLLLAATVLAVYKPRGTTRYGRRRGTS